MTAEQQTGQTAGQYDSRFTDETFKMLVYSGEATDEQRKNALTAEFIADGDSKALRQAFASFMMRTWEILESAEQEMTKEGGIAREDIATANRRTNERTIILTKALNEAIRMCCESRTTMRSYAEQRLKVLFECQDNALNLSDELAKQRARLSLDNAAKPAEAGPQRQANTAPRM